jgi:hypothetical protein
MQGTHQQSGKLPWQITLYKFAKVNFVVLLADWRPPRFSPSVSPVLCVCASLHNHHSNVMGSCSHITGLSGFLMKGGKALAQAAYESITLGCFKAGF